MVIFLIPAVLGFFIVGGMIAIYGSTIGTSSAPDKFFIFSGIFILMFSFASLYYAVCN